MKRRDFNRLVLAGAGISPFLARSSLAQMSAEELQSTPPKAATPTIIVKNSPRTYNQVNVPRKYASRRRRFTIYWTWSYPWEANRDVTELDNRFSTMTEVRRVGWPRYETPEWSEREFLQGIAGTLELFHLSTVGFRASSARLQDTLSLFISASTKPVNAYHSTNKSSAIPIR
jgi:hypothetical protein